ncbi:hypothetical protein [Brevibacterium otitidis]|uniref:Uncharacterized protein n=1 Tax=Brevibacterium otitidis TaxID=53364 RepID=A0ABV5WZY2_9MICO|nr:hypothetical protein GCM10023233_07640 [Brevibacterium otitidis]
MSSVRFEECADTTFGPRMVTVAALSWTAIVAASLMELIIAPARFANWQFLLTVAAIALGVAAVTAIVYWLSLPYGWVITTVAVAVTVAVTQFVMSAPLMLAYLPVLAAPLAAGLVAAAFWLPPMRRYLQHKPR